MATNTTNYNLVKPGQNDFYNIDVHNGNMDRLDILLFDLNKDKVDNVTGKGLSTNDFTKLLKDKLDGIAVGANKYTHPLQHEPSIIEQDINNRFVSDLKINSWDNKADSTTVEEIINNMDSNDKQVRMSLNELMIQIEEQGLIDFIDANTGVGFFDTFKSNNKIDLPGTTATIDNVTRKVDFIKNQILKFKEQTLTDINKMDLIIYDETIQTTQVVSNSALNKVKTLLVPGSKAIGDKLFYKGVEYKITNIEQVV